MIFQAHIPAFPLDQFIAAMVCFERAERAHTVDRFLPNGDVEILIDFHDGPQFVYDNETLVKKQACHRVWASGTRTRPITIPSGDGASMMVISFKKGKAAPFFPFPMSELSDRVVDGDLIWGADLNDLRERLLHAKDLPARFAAAENFFLQRFGSRLELDPCVCFAVDAMKNNPDRLSIAKMNDRIGYSQRHFTEMFRRNLGITPKAYLKIMRFQKAIQLIGETESVDWKNIALDCGFYDQAHFINDFKHFSGFTPEQYASIHSTYQNYIPVG